MGKRGQWSRWGRGMCEGWSLEIGNALRGAVVRQGRIGEPAKWMASVNSGFLGEYPDRETAKARVESDIEHQMKMLLFDWEQYLAARGKPA